MEKINTQRANEAFGFQSNPSLASIPSNFQRHVENLLKILKDKPMPAKRAAAYIRDFKTEAMRQEISTLTLNAAKESGIGKAHRAAFTRHVIKGIKQDFPAQTALPEFSTAPQGHEFGHSL